MSEIDDANKGEDGFLHMTYSGGEEKGVLSRCIDKLPLRIVVHTCLFLIHSMNILLF